MASSQADRDRAARWYAANKERKAAYDSARPRTEARAAAEGDWKKRNSIRVREQLNRRRARKKNATIGHVSYEEILVRDGMVCHICGISIDSKSSLHFDHVVPLSKGGAHSMDNIKPAHSTCNQRKHAKVL